MIPVVPQPPEQFVLVPFDKLRSVRTRSTLIGLVMLPLAVLFGAVGMPWTLFGPTSEDPMTFIVVGMVGVSALFMLMIGAYALMGRSCVKKTGYLSVTACRNLRRVAAVYWGGTFMTTGLSYALVLLMVVTSSASSSGEPIGFNAETYSFLVFLGLPVVLGGAAWTAIQWTLRPSP
ncbi:hypothetical protein REH65_26765 [Saccharopolyspora sp. ID03-671]|uniref:hypothetical protein n=1 Tax=Saccharopolyspora sp. ID03-671 TaxID=3073066 RepID=UPI003253236A